MLLYDDKQEVSPLLYHIRMVKVVKSNLARFRVAIVPFGSNSLAVYNNEMRRLGFRDELNSRPRHYFATSTVIKIYVSIV